MNSKALQVLEYPKIIRHLTDFAASEPGKEKCRALMPTDDINEIRRLQRETTDALNRILRRGRLSFSGLFPIDASLKRLEVGGTLDTKELLRICSVAETAARAKSWAKSEETPGGSFETDSLEQLFDGLQPLAAVSSEIRRCILSEEEISDSASNGLLKVRRRITATNEKIRSQLTSYLSGPSRQYLQDSVITQRDGRFCVPVKAEYRTQVPGMVHDQSSSGSTLFIEPMSVVKLNNDLRELELQERQEMDLMLSALSARVSEHTDELQSDEALLSELDFIFARAQLSLSYNGSEPDFNTEGRIRIKKGRHPLLDPKQVVPVDIRLGDDFTMLVISGPNTGGKTVSLKTVGLFTLLGQAGLHIPAEEHSELSVFKEVFADIGDEQSIEQSLSTFSSHMTNIVSFWSQANEQSLILFDELGAGTDPTEGAALAIAILTDLHRRGIRTIATTHYSELKVFALSTSGVENASCEFNVDTLRPTYRLLIGIPGKSNAFAISQKLGLSQGIIDEAREHLSEQEENFEDVIASLEESRASVEKEESEIARYKEEIKQQRMDLARRQDALNESRETILENARQEAQDILRSTKDYADETIRKFNRLRKDSGSMREMEKERSALREKISENENALGLSGGEKTSKKLKVEDLGIGDPVRVLSLNLNGTVSTLPDQKGNLTVQMGSLNSKVNIKDLEKLDAPPKSRPEYRKNSRSGATAVNTDKSSGISPEINLIGKTKDEAIAELDKYIDDACIAHLSSIRIVHGKGSGVLRKAVQQYLRSQKRVSSFRLGEYGEGDSGVTIAELK